MHKLETPKIFMHEKEREFLDCLRFILESGYVLEQNDIQDILRFICIYELCYSPENEQKRVMLLVEKAMNLLFGINQEYMHTLNELMFEAKSALNDSFIK